MTKRALLIGCNYPGTPDELSGCVNDALNMRDMLLEYKGFKEENIVLMIDTDPNYPQPTGANIITGLKVLALAARSGDVIFVHFSGHGTEMPPEEGEDDDDDGMDQCICPTDTNLITDTDFRDFVNLLPKDCNFIFISDSCHSGGLIDHTKEQIGPNTFPVDNSDGDEEGPGFDDDEGPSFQDLMGSVLGRGGAEDTEDDGDETGYGGEEGYEEEEGYGDSGYGGRDESEGGRWGSSSRGYKSRNLPLDRLLCILSEKKGEKVEQGNIRSSLYGIFGDDASPTIRVFLDLMGQHGGTIRQQFKAGDAKGLMGSLGKIAMGVIKQKFWGDRGSSERDDNEEPDYEEPDIEAPDFEESDYEGSVLEGMDNAVLISGCQSNELSSDINPNPRDPSSAHGALTATLLKVMKEMGPEISYRELVMRTREDLARTGSKQHPCLYGGDHMVDMPFVSE